jgi:hypothetical protein
MIPISSAISGGLKLEKTSCFGSYELRLNGQLMGSIERRSFWSSNYLAVTKDDSWTIRRSGFFCTGAEVAEASTGRPVAQFRKPWGGLGELSFLDGQTFLITSRGWWRPVWSLTTTSGQCVVQLHRREKSVEIPGRGQISDSRLTLLILFVWYRVLQTEEDAAAGAAVAAS